MFILSRKQKGLPGMDIPERPSSRSIQIGLHKNELPHDDLIFYSFFTMLFFFIKVKSLYSKEKASRYDRESYEP
ncbi:MAG TPA: hypothetical protein DD706_11770 [Nitrospiraceae bacterium]|nr:hypothetical protein [Nitrospiraceae bacterium]